MRGATIRSLAGKLGAGSLFLLLLALAGDSRAPAQQLVRQEDAVVALFGLQTELDVEGRLLHRMELRHEENRQAREEAVERVGRLYAELDHLFSLYRALGFREGQFPNAERIGKGIATLPLFPAMEDSDVERVCRAAARVLRRAA